MTPPRSPTALLALALCLLAGPALANPTIAPGLWEQKMTMTSGGEQMNRALAQMQQQLAAMPPQQRRQMEQMLAAQGLSLPNSSGDSGMQMRFCLTPEQAAKQALPPPDGDCTHRITQRSASSLRMSMECPAKKTRGEGEFRFASPRAYDGRFTVQTEQAGQPMSMEMALAARWLGADCGSVKPVE